MLWLDFVEVGAALFLGEGLSQDGLVSLILLLLGLDVIHVLTIATFSKESLVFVLFINLGLCCLVELSLGTLLQLVHKRHRHILSPQFKLCLQLIVLRQLREKGLVGVRRHGDLFELSRHAVHDLLSLLARHVVKVKVLFQDGLVLSLEESLSRHVHKCATQTVLRLLLWVSVVVVILLGRIHGVLFFLELFGAQGYICIQSRETLPAVEGNAGRREAEVSFLNVCEGERLHVPQVLQDVLASLVDLFGVAGYLLVENAGPHQSIQLELWSHT